MSTVQVYAGPNGSGKSTITGEVPVMGRYINADEIQRYLQCTPLEAAQNAEATREYCLENHMDFTMETVLSTPRNINLLHRAKEQGYYIICFYVLTCDPEINVHRVAERVARGGHDVPEEKIRSRYERSLKNLPLLPTLCDEFYVFDNSMPRGSGEPALIVKCIGGNLEFRPSARWNMEMLLALMEGRGFKEYMRDNEEYEPS